MSELEPGLARGVGQRLDPAMILVASAVEADLVNPGLLGALGDGLAHERRGGLVAAVGGLALDLGVEGRGRGEGLALVVVDDLGVDVLRAPEDAEPRALGRAGQLLADPPLDRKSVV